MSDNSAPTFSPATFTAITALTDRLTQNNELPTVIERVSVERTTAEVEFLLLEPHTLLAVAFEEDDA